MSQVARYFWYRRPSKEGAGGSKKKGKVRRITLYIENRLWMKAVCNDESCPDKQYTSVFMCLLFIPFLRKMTAG